MKQAIHFSGLSGVTRTVPKVHSSFSTTPSVDGMVQEFFHYLGHIWLEKYSPPQRVEELAAFKIREVITAYRAYRASGGTIPLDEGLGLEASYLVTQIVARTPLTCLLNAEKVDLSTERMARVSQLPPKEIIATFQRNQPVKLNTAKDITDQLRRWGKLCPLYTTLVLDGTFGHCIMLAGMEQVSDRLVFWDPWPLRSLLCEENNTSNVAATPVQSEESYWTASTEEMMRIIYAVFIPTNDC